MKGKYIGTLPLNLERYVCFTLLVTSEILVLSLIHIIAFFFFFGLFLMPNFSFYLRVIFPIHKLGRQLLTGWAQTVLNKRFLQSLFEGFSSILKKHTDFPNVTCNSVSMFK